MTNRVSTTNSAAPERDYLQDTLEIAMECCATGYGASLMPRRELPGS